MSKRNALEDQELAYPNMCSGLMIFNSDDDNDNNGGDNNLQLSNKVEYHMKNYPDQDWIDNTLQDLHYSSYHMKAD